MLSCHTKCKKKPIIISSITQVEDVNKKFDALKDAESRAWVEEHKPPPPPKRLVKVKSLHVHTINGWCVTPHRLRSKTPL